MIGHSQIRLARPQDARRIALMSKSFIEVGLGWSWTEQRVLASIKDRESNVPVAIEDGRVIGFCIAKYKTDEGHILLLAVDEAHRRRGVGRTLVRWVEKTALVAGIGIMYLEARQGNSGARKFYGALGYREFRLERGRYRGIETGVRLGKDLWA